MRRPVLIAIAWALPLAVCAGWAAARAGRSALEGPPSSVVFPDQEIPLVFTHARHLGRGLECLDCHGDARTSRSSVDRLIPTEADCTGCHAVDRTQPDKQVAAGKAPARCDTCHPSYDPAAPMGAMPRVRIPTPNLKFDHAAHVSRGVDCRTCHGDLVGEGTGLATRDNLPRMRLCLTCHDGRRAPSACTTCHIADPGGRVRTDYPSGKLVPSGVLRGDAHDLTFRTSHGEVARNDERYCASCHQKRFCVDCHDGVVKPMDFHASDYVSLHPIDARRNTPDCSACHRLQTFCVGCHNRSGLGADILGPRASDFVPPLASLGSNFNDKFHSKEWQPYVANQVETRALRNDRPIRSIKHHSFQAQRNIMQCASCHREQFCTFCHSQSTIFAGAQSVASPHPNDWRGSRRCRMLAARAGRICLRCHVDVREASCDFDAM